MSPAAKPLWQRFLVFLVPLMISNILQSMSGTINNIFIGQMIGVDALAAVSTFFPIMILMISFVVGLASGAAILIGQAYGAKNFEKIREVTGTTLTVTFLAALVIAGGGWLLAPQLISLLGAADNIAATASDYARVVFLGMPFFFVFMVLTSMLRGVSDTTTPLWTLGFSILAGLVVTPALIEGWFGLPKIGALAAAVAFITGTVLALIFLYFYLDWRKSPLAPSTIIPRYLKIDLKLLGMVLKLGIPQGVAMMVSSLAAIVVVGIVNRFGSDATAAFGAVNQVMSYVQFPAMSLTIASSIFAAQAIGAKRMDEVEHVTRTGLIMNVFITGGLILIAYLFSENLVRLFITSESVVVMTQTLLHIVLWSVIAFGFGSVFSAVMRASGDVWIPMGISLAAILVIEVPAALILSRLMGLEGIWFAYCLSFVAMLIMQATYYFVFWRKKEINALV
ncbi:MAG TPA: MATE family efflux transporter [Devosia sp.]|nr:MATE family efflux transporter [Devosia sp.]